MIPVLRMCLVHLWVACIAGAVVIAGLTMGFVSAATFLWAAVIGVALGVPAALLNWVYLRPNRSRQIGWTWGIADQLRHLSDEHSKTSRPRWTGLYK
jgi:hypothetical protein